MQVFFDYQAFEQHIGGVSRSYAELISHIRDEGCNCVVGIKESDNVYLQEKRLARKVKSMGYLHHRLFETKPFFKGQRYLTEKTISLLGYQNRCWQINKDYSIKLLKKQRFDVFEPTFFDSYFLPYLKGKPFVMTVHDMIPELFPEYYSRDDFQIVQKRKLCPLASHIHVPSFQTKKDLMDILNIDESKITVIPHGAPEIPNETVFESKVFGFPYILYVGDRYGYKNFVPLLNECAKLFEQNKDVKLVCTGKPFNEAEKELMSRLSVSNRVIHYFASGDDFPTLYRHAIVFVYPSLYEGFGIPILEAFAYGCPVMLNEASCFPEVAGEAAVYFHLTDKDSDFCEKFKQLYSLGKEERRGLIEKGYQRLKMYSWKQSAKQLMDVYNNLL